MIVVAPRTLLVGQILGKGSFAGSTGLYTCSFMLDFSRVSTLYGLLCLCLYRLHVEWSLMFRALGLRAWGVEIACAHVSRLGGHYRELNSIC